MTCAFSKFSLILFIVLAILLGQAQRVFAQMPPLTVGKNHSIEKYRFYIERANYYIDSLESLDNSDSVVQEKLAHFAYFTASCYFRIQDIYDVESRDSCWYYFIKSAEFDERFLCRSVQREYEMVDMLEEANKAHLWQFFALELFPHKTDSIYNYCISTYGNLKNESSPSDYGKYEDQMNLINLHDQSERAKSNVDWKVQDSLDRKNRVILDELYHSSGGDVLTSGDCHKVIWLVLQHSTSCAWNEVWLDRYLSALSNGLIKDVYIANTIRRHYHIDTGACIKNNKDRSIMFINRIIESYPEYPIAKWVGRN